MKHHDHASSLSRWAGIGALSASIGVGLGAFGAHALTSVLTADMLAVFETGVRYQMYHAGGMIAAGLAGLAWSDSPRRLIKAAWSFGIGTVAFSGSLYLMALTGVRWVGVITPVGGLSFIIGWLLMASALFQRVRVEFRQKNDDILK